jgi:hypothetical protein
MPTEESAKPSSEERKSYSQPRLQVYGDLRALTQAQGLPTKPDGLTRTAGTRPAS